MRLLRNNVYSFKSVRRLIKLSLWLLAILLFFVLLATALLLDRQQAYPAPSKLSTQEAKEATDFLTHASKTLINARSTVSLRATQSQVNSSFALIHKTYDAISGYSEIEHGKASFYVSFRLQLLGQYFFINSSAHLLPDPQQLSWHAGKIGSLRLNDTMSRWIFRRFIQGLLGKHYGRKIIAGISGIQISNKDLTIAFTPPENFREGFANAVKHMSSYSGKELNFDTPRVQHYLDILVDYTRGLPKQPISLSRYLQILMNEAHTRSLENQLAPQENTAAIYALAIQIAPGTFRHFVADLKVKRLNATHKPQLTLSGRSDLAQHFIYSAAIKILADKGVSFSIGETKELIDTNTTGFSFADIAADKSGIRFSTAAIDNPRRAVALQKYSVQHLSESDFFPSLTNLPEGLSEAEFLQHFRDTQSIPYRTLMKNIDARIENAGLFYHLGTEQKK